MPPEPGHRASDADREAVSAVVRDAAGEGRLGLDEVDERLDAVWKARTYGELALVTRDLPGPVEDVRPPAARPLTPGGVGRSERTPVVPGPVRETGTAIAVFSGHERTGAWRVPADLTAVAVFGGVELDLRLATLTAPETVIHVFAMFGGVEITVPDDVDVRVSGVGVLGGFHGAAGGDTEPGAPVVRVVGVAVMGGVEVRRRPRPAGRVGARVAGGPPGGAQLGGGGRGLGDGPRVPDEGRDRRPVADLGDDRHREHRRDREHRDDRDDRDVRDDRDDREHRDEHRRRSDDD